MAITNCGAVASKSDGGIPEVSSNPKAAFVTAIAVIIESFLSITDLSLNTIFARFVSSPCLWDKRMERSIFDLSVTYSPCFLYRPINPKAGCEALITTR
jgi:hypothetical protein